MTEILILKNGSERPTRPTILNKGLRKITAQAEEKIKVARSEVTKYKNLFSKGKHQIDGLPLSSKIATAEGVLERALKDGKLFLTKAGLTSVCQAERMGVELGLRAGWHFSLREADLKQIDQAKQDRKDHIPTTEGQKECNTFLDFHRNNGQVSGQSHRLNVKDGNIALSTTTTHTSSISGLLK